MELAANGLWFDRSRHRLDLAQMSIDFGLVDLNYKLSWALLAFITIMENGTTLKDIINFLVLFFLTALYIILYSQCSREIMHPVVCVHFLLK